MKRRKKHPSLILYSSLESPVSSFICFRDSIALTLLASERARQAGFESERYAAVLRAPRRIGRGVVQKKKTKSFPNVLKGAEDVVLKSERSSSERDEDFIYCWKVRVGREDCSSRANSIIAR